MRRLPAVVATVAGVLLAGGTGFAVVEREERAGLAQHAEQACGGRDEPEPGTPTELPLGLPASPGSQVLRVTEQGRTVVAFARVEGGRDEIVVVRDRVLAQLEGAGYRVVGTDQEPGFEAEAELAGTYEGTLKVSPLCDGLLELRYKIDA